MHKLDVPPRVLVSASLDFLPDIPFQPDTFRATKATGLDVARARMNMYGHEASHLVAALAIAVPVGCLFVTPKPAAGDGFSGGVTATGKTKHAEALLCFVGCVYERATNGTMKRAFNDAQDGVLAAGGLKKELLLDADAFVQHFDGVIKMAAIGAYHLADKSGNTGGAELARLTDWLRPHIRDELPQWVVGREDRWRVAVGSGALCSICN